MPYLWLSVMCPKHGLERFKIKIIRKYNIRSDSILLKFRTHPTFEISGVIIGRKIDYNHAKDYVLNYLKETGMLDKVINMRLQL